ncbi:PilZ domain-containing protein [Methylobacterium oryzisoli]|uniref:PilZ domain-containing protein n=1 Tax=Methylobacterium oryzisoli TaxID=3385502 RepID=UPI003892AE2B
MQQSREGSASTRRSDSRATALRVVGRFLLPNGAEHACETRTLSPDHAELVTAVQGLPGDSVTIYLDNIGVLSGVITGVTPSGFSVAITVGAERRARIAARLDWHAARASGMAEQRSDTRIVPAETAVRVRLPDGGVMSGRLIDLSMTGAALAVAARPDLGATVTVGKRFATVVRHLDGGIAVTFKLPFRPETFNESVVL